MESWQEAYTLSTGTYRRIYKYCGMDFTVLLNLPYSAFLLLAKESWIDSFMGYEDGREMLKALWRLQQTKADTRGITAFKQRREKRGF